jgi:hypothetical protein
VSYGIVQAHSGDIEVDSRPGVGTVFTVTLPLKPPELPAPVASVAAVSEPAAKSGAGSGVEERA